MKEFEKWWKAQEGKWSLICCPAMAKESWRAALELVLNMFAANTFHGYPPIDVEKALKEELGKTK
jgi:hypothetical protein